MKEKEIKKSIPYVRVGTQYYKYILHPLASGDNLEKLVGWNVETIVRDFGKTYVGSIPKYDGFCLIPEHLDYKEVIKNHLNKYEPITVKPSAGDYSRVLEFLKHIFEEQIEIGLDYLAVLYCHPMEKLPVLCLVSKERGTGKTTFLNFLKLIFGGNFTYNTNEDFRSQFNSHWSSKLVVAVDEVLLDKREDSERIKNLSTARTYKAESKGVDKTEVEIICKFILCSNNTHNFIYIEPGETRYWVREIKTFTKENENLLSQLKEQIPAFLNFIINRKIQHPKTSRMWFDFKIYETPALRKLIRANRNRLEMQLAHTIMEIIECFDLEEYSFCIKDVQTNLSKSNRAIVDHSNIIRVVKDEWKLSPNPITSTYTTYIYGNDGFLKKVSDKGRYYTLKKEWIKENFDDLMI